MPIISIYGKEYDAEEYFVLKPSAIRKWVFSYFFRTLRSIDHCNNENVDVYFYRSFYYMMMLVVCHHYEGSDTYDMTKLVTTLGMLEKYLMMYSWQSFAYIDLLDGVAEKLIIRVNLPKTIYNYYRKRHKDKIIAQ